MGGDVALLAEGVDRNSIRLYRVPVYRVVALLAEGVDRNEKKYEEVTGKSRRPPRGGRG